MSAGYVFQLVSFVGSLIGVSYFMGKQANQIAQTKRDVDSLGLMHRHTIETLNQVNLQLVKIGTKLEEVEKRL